MITPMTPQVPAPHPAFPPAGGGAPTIAPSEIGPSPEPREWPSRAPIGLGAAKHCGWCWKGAVEPERASTRPG